MNPPYVLMYRGLSLTYPQSRRGRQRDNARVRQRENTYTANQQTGRKKYIRNHSDKREESRT
uniref:Uncharacterized protein n=1 Tax=Anguilla anguilla TaxID=7936 RepID=A0A0E9SEW5_ANGAN